jgi:hypothetical protein
MLHAAANDNQFCPARRPEIQVKSLRSKNLRGEEFWRRVVFFIFQEVKNGYVLVKSGHSQM